MWDNKTKEGVARKLGEAVAEVEVHEQGSNMTDDVWTLHRFGDDLIPDVGTHGHHHKTIQDPHLYRRMKTANNRRKDKAAKSARKRNRR